MSYLLSWCRGTNIAEQRSEAVIAAAATLKERRLIVDAVRHEVERQRADFLNTAGSHADRRINAFTNEVSRGILWGEAYRITIVEARLEPFEGRRWFLYFLAVAEQRLTRGWPIPRRHP